MISDHPTAYRQIGNYTVTSDGSVFTQEHTAIHFGNMRRTVPAKRRAITHRAGIAEIWLFMDGKRIRFRLDRLVASLFLGDRGPDWTVKHINGDSLDCRLENLEWVKA